jgi:hypothetical protein
MVSGLRPPAVSFLTSVSGILSSRIVDHSRERTDMRLGSSGILMLFSLGASMAVVAPAPAETVNCTAVITTLPYTISASGVYCLTDDLNTNLASGNAIEIAANSVILDLNGHKIGNLSAGPGNAATGIYAAQRQNITIKNGTVRGFLFGISLDDTFPYTNSQGHVVEDIRADRNTYAGISALGRGIVVRNSQVAATGGTTLFAPNANAYGIQVYGPGNRVLDNDVVSVTKQGSGTAWGIYFASSTDDGVAVNNRITEAGVALEMTVVSVKYRDNLTLAVATPFTGGTNIGNNN